MPAAIGPEADERLDGIAANLGCDARRALGPECWALHSGGEPRYVLKRRPASFTQCASAFRLLRGVQDTDNLINIPIGLESDGNHQYTTERFLPGDAGPERAMPLMPAVFSRLARFHLANRRNGPVTSMYADGAEYPTVRAMLEAEFSYHEGFWKRKERIDEIRARVMELDGGFSTVLHGDVHAGNVIATDAEATLIDTEWSLVGLNLFEFEHVDLLDIGRDYPERIRREASACCRSYFGELGVGMRRAAELMSALGALKVMRQHTYALYKKDDAALAAIPAALEAALDGVAFD